MSSEQVCRSCGAPIIWVEMEGGKRMPLDANSAMQRVVVDGKREKGAIRLTFVSHFATCPHAAQHRTPKEPT